MITAFFFPLALTLLAQAPDAPASQPAAGPRAGAADLFDLLPVETLVAVTIDPHERAFPDALLRAIAAFGGRDEKQADRFVEAVRAIPGHIAIASIPPRKDEGVFLLLIDVARPSFDARDYFQKHIIPITQSFGRRDEYDRLDIEGTDSAFRIINAKNEETVMYVSARGRIIAASNDGNLVRKIGTDGDRRDSLVRQPGMRDIIRRLPKDAPLRILFRPAILLEKSKKPKPGSTDELAMQILQPTDILGAGGFLKWRGREIEITAVAALADECKGISRWLDRSDTESKLMAELANDFPVVVRAGFSSLAGLPSAIYEITDEFDPTIREEYREDLATFQKETGVDFNGALLAQVTDECVIGIRPDFARQPPVGWVAVAPLNDASIASTAATKLATHYNLPMEDEDRDGLIVHSSSAPSEFSWAVTTKRLIIGDSPRTVRDVARSAGSRGKASRGLQSQITALGAKNQFAFIADIGLLKKQAPLLPVMAGPNFGPLLTGGFLGASLSQEDRFAHLKIRWELVAPVRKDESETRADNATTVVATTVLEMLANARTAAQRTIGMARIRGLCMAVNVYTESHQGAFPDSLETLLRDPAQIATLELLRNPYTDEGPDTIEEVAEYSHILFRNGLQTPVDPQEIIFGERSVARKGQTPGANFGFADGHVEFIEEPDASRLIELIETGAESVSRAALAENNAP